MEGLINNPLHVAIHALCIWAGRNIADRTNFFSHNLNSASHIGYTVFWIFILFGIGFRFYIYPGVFNGNDQDVARSYQEKWLVCILIGFIPFLFGYIFSLITARLGLSKPYEPEGSWVYGDICLQSMRNALEACRGGDKELSELLVALDGNYKPIPKEAASRRWKQELKNRISQLRTLDSIDFEGGRKGLDESDQQRLNQLFRQLDAQLAEAETRLERCFERRKHKPGQWYR